MDSGVGVSVGAGVAVGDGVGSGVGTGVGEGVAAGVGAKTAAFGAWPPQTDSSARPSTIINPHTHRFMAPILQSFAKMRNKKPEKDASLSGFWHGMVYQMLMRFSGAMYILSAAVTPKASYHSGKFRGDMLALSSPGE